MTTKDALTNSSTSGMSCEEADKWLDLVTQAQQFANRLRELVEAKFNAARPPTPIEQYIDEQEAWAKGK